MPAIQKNRTVVTPVTHQRVNTETKLPKSTTDLSFMGLKLPFTGIEQPFTKRKPKFVGEAPMFEPVTGALNRSNIGSRIVNNKVPTNYTALKLTELLPRLVYDCSVPLPQDPNPSQPNKYCDKLQSYYTPIASNDPTLVFESRFESGNLHRAT
jgi:hypothetical protein